MTVFDRQVHPLIKKIIERFSESSDRAELQKTLSRFKWRYFYAIARKTGTRLPFRLISIAAEKIVSKMKRKDP